MLGFAMTAGAIHVVRIDPGEDVLDVLRSYCSMHGIRQAAIVQGYGTLAAWSLHWVTHNRIPTSNLFDHGEGGIELLSMNGMIVDGEPHVHVALADREHAFGGHMEPGCRAYVVCEVVLAELHGAQLTRERVHVTVEGMGEGVISRLVEKTE